MTAARPYRHRRAVKRLTVVDMLKMRRAIRRGASASAPPSLLAEATQARKVYAERRDDLLVAMTAADMTGAGFNTPAGLVELADDDPAVRAEASRLVARAESRRTER